MKRSHLLFLTAVASLALLLFVVSVLPEHSDPVLAAPRPNRESLEELLGSNLSPLYQVDDVFCTLTVTTTDSLDNINACPVGQNPGDPTCQAVALADYNNLALVPDGSPDEELLAHTDWFRVDNTAAGELYTMEALPDTTDNYNLGIFVYDSNFNEILSDVNPTDNNRAQVSLLAEGQGPYYFQVAQISASCEGGTYDVESSFTAAPAPADEDAYEPNNTFEDAPALPVQVPLLLDLTFHSVDDIDFFQFYTKGGQRYETTTSNLDGVDTLLEVYNRDRIRIAIDDDGADGLASKLSWTAAYDGYYFIVVQNNVQSTGSYDLNIQQVTAPTSTPSPTPPPARGTADDCEPNGSFDQACVIPVNAEETFNFVPLFGEGPDNDFYKVWVKPGLHYRCQTSDLSPGVDPNMIVFTGPSWDAAIGGNDDIEPCNFNSSFTYFSDYAGWLYLLLGTGDRTPSDVFNSDYTLLCEKSTTPFLATSTPPPTVYRDPSGKLPSPVPTATPTPTPTEPSSPLATPTEEAQALSVRPLTASAIVPTPHPRFLPVSLLIYYDANGDGQRGAGEGIAGISARAYEIATNELLAQDYTDAQGSLTFSVSAQGPVRLSVPFLSLSHLIIGEEATLQVRVPPQPGIGGAP